MDPKNFQPPKSKSTIRGRAREWLFVVLSETMMKLFVVLSETNTLRSIYLRDWCFIGTCLVTTPFNYNRNFALLHNVSNNLMNSEAAGL